MGRRDCSKSHCRHNPHSLCKRSCWPHRYKSYRRHNLQERGDYKLDTSHPVTHLDNVQRRYRSIDQARRRDQPGTLWRNVPQYRKFRRDRFRRHRLDLTGSLHGDHSLPRNARLCTVRPRGRLCWRCSRGRTTQTDTLFLLGMSHHRPQDSDLGVGSNRRDSAIPPGIPRCVDRRRRRRPRSMCCRAGSRHQSDKRAAGNNHRKRGRIEQLYRTASRRIPSGTHLDLGCSLRRRPRREGTNLGNDHIGNCCHTVSTTPPLVDIDFRCCSRGRRSNRYRHDSLPQTAHSGLCTDCTAHPRHKYSSWRTHTDLSKHRRLDPLGSLHPQDTRWSPRFQSVGHRRRHILQGRLLESSSTQHTSVTAASIALHPRKHARSRP